MNIINEDLLLSGVDYKFCMASGTVKNNELLMNFGLAITAKQMYDYLPSYFGNQLVTSYNKVDSNYQYGLLLNQQAGIGIIQTKYSYRDGINSTLVKSNLHKLAVLAKRIPTKLIGVELLSKFLKTSEDKFEVNYILEGLPHNIIIFGE